MGEGVSDFMAVAANRRPHTLNCTFQRERERAWLALCHPWGTGHQLTHLWPKFRFGSEQAVHAPWNTHTLASIQSYRTCSLPFPVSALVWGLTNRTCQQGGEHQEQACQSYLTQQHLQKLRQWSFMVTLVPQVLKSMLQNSRENCLLWKNNEISKASFVANFTVA